jgi:Tfp pilus assembly protein PilE
MTVLRCVYMRFSRLRSGRLAQEDGVTLFELVTVMAMLGIGLTTAFFFYQAAVGRTSDTEARVDTLSEQRVLIENISRESREAARLVVDSGGGVLDIYGVAGSSSATREVIRYDCSSTPGTCTRMTYAWSSGGYGDTVAVVPAFGAALTTPTIEIQGLDPSLPAFSGTPSPAGSPLTTFTVQLQSVPEGRDRPIRLTREITARNVCIYPVTSPAPEADACAG